MRHDLTNDETCTTPETIREKGFPQTDEVGDGTDAETNSEQLSPTNANLRSKKHDLLHNPRPKCNEDDRF